ncbi:MAG: ABC transporter permease [Elusimicrobia bacterium]|nr:ABC transporter permease [Elusimicrobiota bacterium]
MKRLRRWEEAGAAAALLSLLILFTALSPGFATLRTAGNVLTFAAVLGVIALGSTLLMAAGEFDLSVGSMAALAGMLFAMGTARWSCDTYAMAGVALAVGTLLGLLNGAITLSTGIPSFITTLGTMLLWRGAVLGVSGGFPVSWLDERRGVLIWLGSTLGAGLSSGALWWLAAAGLLAWLLKATPFGNHVLATGGNAAAARGMGVNTRRVKLACFGASGLLASLAGLILFSQLRDLSPTAGESYELYGIASAVIGGTPLAGGAGTIGGTVLGTLIIGVVQAGLVHSGIDSYWFRCFVGVLLVGSVIVNVRLKRVAQP